MHQYDVWLDIECTVDDTLKVICTVYAKRQFEVRPVLGESITFWSAQRSDVSFKVVSIAGTQPVHYASTEVEELAHHFHPDESQNKSSTLLRCRPLRVASILDAKQLVAFLTSQH